MQLFQTTGIKKMKTIPDLITDIKYYYKRSKDLPLRFIERLGSKLNSWAWNKRWGNKDQGTGYGRRT